MLEWEVHREYDTGIRMIELGPEDGLLENSGGILEAKKRKIE